MPDFNSESVNEAPNYTLEQALHQIQQLDDPSARYYAAWWLGRFRIDSQEALNGLLEALTDESDRSSDGGYPLRRNAAKALGKLGNLKAVEPLIVALDCEDYYVRESVAQALEMLEDKRGITPLMNLLEGGVEKAQMVEGTPHLVQPYEAIIEALGTLKATEAIPLIQPFLNHFVPKVQYAAARALYQLTRDKKYGEILVEALNGEQLQLRRSALMDLGASGYLVGAEAIAQTLAENSLKLVALKGLLESDLKYHPLENGLTPESLNIMELMDNLL
ncbi:MAG: HEAT repeat domain-containing protein [Microcystaceae cyanobacterium]